MKSLKARAVPVAGISTYESHDDEDLDPIIFGHAVEVYYQEAFDKHRETFEKLGVNPIWDLAVCLKKCVL